MPLCLGWQLEEVEQRKKLQLKDEELLDELCSHIGETVIKATISTDDESEIVVGDVATVTVQMCRKQLQKDEAQGPVHAPFFPIAKFEEWWLFLVDSGAKERIVHFERVCETERCVEEKLRFQVTKAGENNLVLHALCDAYAGLDYKVELTFHAHAEEEVLRKMPVHKEDEDLDLQPTLFQQWMGDLKGDESEEEEEAGEEPSKPPPKRPEREVDDGDDSDASSSGSD
ncbi:unnamed protein product [Effrenium voratum]|nr:unnamed protein product [Effrenium voratum]